MTTRDQQAKMADVRRQQQLWKELRTSFEQLVDGLKGYASEGHSLERYWGPDCIREADRVLHDLKMYP